MSDELALFAILFLVYFSDCFIWKHNFSVVFVSWTCSRTVFGRKLTTDSASAGRVVMRVN